MSTQHLLSRHASLFPTSSQFYSLFKQINKGPCPKRAPSRFNVIARAKYDAWKSVSHLSKDQAMQAYLDEMELSSPGWEKSTSLRSKL